MVQYIKKPVSESSQEQQTQPKKPVIEYNDKTFQSWVNLGLDEVTIPHLVEAPHTRLEGFLSRVDLEQGPIERKVTSMVRFKAKNRGDKESKEFLKYYEDWSGKNWMGQNLKVGDNIEGVYMEQEKEKIIRYNEMKGPEIVGYKRSGEHTVYTIPFSKEAVDKAIGDQDKSDITFVVRTPERRQHFLYDEFVNFSWEQLEDILMMDGGAEAARVERKMQGQGKNVKTANKLDFKPS